MNQIVALLTLVVLSVHVHAQTSFEHLQQLAGEMSSNQEKFEFLHAKQQESQSFSPIEQVRFWHMLGMSQDKLDKIDEAFESFSKAISIFEQSGLPLTADLPLAYIERSYMQYLKTFKPEDYCQDREKAVALIRQLPDETTLKAKILVQASFCYHKDIAQFKQGLALLEEAIDIGQQHTLPNNLHGMIHNATGSLYMRNQLFDKAYEHTLKAYQYWQLENDYSDMFNMLHTLVGTAIHRLDFVSAQQHVNELFALAESQPQFNDFYFFAHYNQGLLYKEQKEYERAIASLNQSITLQETTEEKYFVRTSYEYVIASAFRLKQYDVVKDALNALQENFPEAGLLFRETKAISLFINGEQSHAFNTLITELDSGTDKRRRYMKQSNEAAGLIYSQNLLSLDNKVLQQSLEINKLLLSEQRNQNKFFMLSLSFAFAMLVGSAYFIFYLMRTRKAFKTRAQTDYLTGIANRRYCFEQGEQLINAQQKQSKAIALMIFDIDHFKKVNDLFGHDYGDHAIKLVVDKAKEALRKQDLFARIGGEEFLVLLPDTSPKQAQDIAHRLNKAVATLTVSKNNIDMPLSVSIGVAQCHSSESMDEVIARADEALYQAKDTGRNKVVAV